MTNYNLFQLLADVEELIGTKELLDSLVDAMGTYDLEENLRYICRMWDIDIEKYECPFDLDENTEEFIEIEDLEKELK